MIERLERTIAALKRKIGESNLAHAPRISEPGYNQGKKKTFRATGNGNGNGNNGKKGGHGALSRTTLSPKQREHTMRAASAAARSRSKAAAKASVSVDEELKAEVGLFVFCRGCHRVCGGCHRVCRVVPLHTRSNSPMRQ